MKKATTTPEDITDLYKTLLEQENSNHTIFITVLLGFTVILITATWYFNRFGIKKMILKEVQKIFNVEKDKIIDGLKVDMRQVISKELKAYEKNLKSTQGDVARSLGISAAGQGLFAHAIYWASQFLNANIDIDNQIYIRLGIKMMIEYTDRLKQQEEIEFGSQSELDETYTIVIHKAEKVIKVIHRIPEIMNDEKQSLLEFTEQRVEKLTVRKN